MVAVVFTLGVVLLLFARLAYYEKEPAMAWVFGIAGVVVFFVTIFVGVAEDRENGFMSTVTVDESFKHLQMGMRYEVMGEGPIVLKDSLVAVVLRDFRGGYHLYPLAADMEWPPCRAFSILDTNADGKREFHCLE